MLHAKSILWRNKQKLGAKYLGAFKYLFIYKLKKDNKYNFNTRSKLMLTMKMTINKVYLINKKDSQYDR